MSTKTYTEFWELGIAALNRDFILSLWDVVEKNLMEFKRCLLKKTFTSVACRNSDNDVMM